MASDAIAKQGRKHQQAKTGNHDIGQPLGGPRPGHRREPSRGGLAPWLRQAAAVLLGGLPAKGQGRQVKTLRVHRHPMHLDVGFGKVRKTCHGMTSRFVRDGNHDIGGPSAVNQLVEAIESADNRNRVCMRMHRQVTAAKLGSGGLLMAGVHEADDHELPRGVLAHLMQEFPGIATCANQNDPRPRESPVPIRVISSPKFQGILHELPPIRRSVARITGALGPLSARGTIHGTHASQRD